MNDKTVIKSITGVSVYFIRSLFELQKANSDNNILPGGILLMFAGTMDNHLLIKVRITGPLGLCASDGLTIYYYSILFIHFR